jgi:hypothetical protein
VNMAKRFVPASMRRKRGNPNWGRPTPAILAAATEFEMSSTVGTHEARLCRLASVTQLVRAQQEPVLHPGMAA